jgi:hypothetical protein
MATDGREQDRRIFHGVLSLLYAARRRDPMHGGVGAVTLEKLLGVPRQHLEFPIWYLKKRGWVETMDNGQYGITVEGIDKLGDRDMAVPQERLLAASSVVGNRARGDDVQAAAEPAPPSANGNGNRPSAPAPAAAAGTETASQPEPPQSQPGEDEFARARELEQRLRGVTS